MGTAGRTGRESAVDHQLKRRAELVVISLSEGAQLWHPLGRSNVLCSHWKGCVVQIKLPQKHKAAQVSGCRECQSLALELDDSRDNNCVQCNQADVLLIMVAALREEVESLRSIRDPEEEIGWWSHSTPSLWQLHQPAAPQEAEDPFPTVSPHQAEEGDLRDGEGGIETCLC